MSTLVDRLGGKSFAFSMDDADSGIYQSRTESVVDSSTVSLSTGENEVSSLKDHDSNASGTDELSDISSLESDEISSVSSSCGLSDGDDYTSQPVASQLPKKRLSISDSFLATSIGEWSN